MVLGKKVSIFDWEWGRNSAPRDGQKRPCWGSLGLNFDYDGGPIIENGGPIFLYKPGSAVVECLTRDRRAASSSLTGVTALWSLSKTHSKTRPFITERLLMGRKESKQTKHISVEFWKVVHPSMKRFEQALAVKQVSQNIRSFSYLNHL